MARKLRKLILKENGYYHLISRGNNQKPIFNGPGDYAKWKDYLFGYKKKYKAKVLSYVLMPNHYHLLVKIGIDLPSLMGAFNTRYAIYFNRKHNLTGHLFEQRYRSFPVMEDPYIVALIRYIHNNPVRAGLIEKAFDYKHSSLKDYLNEKGLTDIEIVKKLFNNKMGTPLKKITS